MSINNVNIQIQLQFAKMCSTGKLFRSVITGQQVWDAYLSSFKPEDNKVFRDPNSSEHNCNTCKNFIRRYGNIVAISNTGNIESIFSIETIDLGSYQNSLNACKVLLESNPIANVFFETFDELNSLPYERCSKNQSTFRLGIAENFKQYTDEEAAKYGGVNTKTVYTFNHFYLNLPKQFVNSSGKSIEAIMSEYRSNYDVFKRTMEEISLDSLILTRDLINQDSLRDSTKHLTLLNEIITLKSQYTGSDNWLWSKSYELQGKSKFINSSIGEFIKQVNEGKELNSACLMYNKMVDPANYMKATTPITEAQKKKFVEEVIELGLEEAFIRRLATMDDIKASEILHINRDNSVKNVSIFDGLQASKSKHKRAEFDKVEEVTIDKFMSDILPTLGQNGGGMEVYLENKHEGNLCNITMPVNKESKNFFKYNNGYNVTFNGNLAGKSDIKENVKKAGGKINAFMRFSIQWNDKDTKGIVDFDAHCKNPHTEIYYANKRCINTGGQLDVDMINPSGIGVENIYWSDKATIKDGRYYFFNRNYNNMDNKGFKAELEINGEVFNYSKFGNLSSDTPVVTVTFKNGTYSIEHHLSEESFNKDLWSLETNNFHKVNLVCLSPNYWNEDKVGNKYYLFMLQGAKNSNKVRGFHNEHIIPELLQHHKKCLDYFGNIVMCDPIDNQLAGLGFNSTVRDEVIVKLTGSFKRIIKIKI